MVSWEMVLVSLVLVGMLLLIRLIVVMIFSSLVGCCLEERVVVSNRRVFILWIGCMGISFVVWSLGVGGDKWFDGCVLLCEVCSVCF